MLKQIETNRWTTIADMAEHHVVSTKTIRRDLAALMEAGFPLYDERYEGKVYWRLSDEYKGLPLATLSLSETAALYFSKKTRRQPGCSSLFGRHCFGIQEDRKRIARSQH